MTLCRIGGFENQRTVRVFESLHRRLVADACRDDVILFRFSEWIHHHVVPVVDGSADHAVSLHTKKENFLRRDEAAIHRDVALPMLREKRGLTRVNLSIVWNGLGLSSACEAKQTHPARARRISLDVTLSRE